MAQSDLSPTRRLARSLVAALLGLTLIACSRSHGPPSIATPAPTPSATPASTAGAPSPSTAASRSLSPSAGPVGRLPVPSSVVIGEAYHALLAGLVLPVQPDGLLKAAWKGAVEEARRAGVRPASGDLALSADAGADLVAFQQAYADLLSHASGRLDEGTLEEAALTAMAESVQDCHTAYVRRDRYASINADLNGEELLPDLPLSFQLGPPYLITTVVQGSNATKAGVRAGDRIVAFDGAGLDSIPLSQRKFLSLGAAGSSVTLTLASPDGKQRTLTVQREQVRRPVIETRLNQEVGYIRLRTFTLNLNRSIDAAIADLQRQGARGFVLDLRGNLGGGLPADVHLLSHFIPSGVLAATSGRGVGAQVIRTDGSLLPGPPPLAVLVDGGSLSASELFAEDIKDFQAGVIVGERTPGCLLASDFRPLSDGSAMQVTSADVRVGPRRLTVNHVGVAPDIAIAPAPSDLAAARDPQLDRAIAEVRAKLR